MATTIDGSLGLTTPTYGGTVAAEYSVPVTAFKNRIINGAMMIDQRNAGASVTPTHTSYFLDRWTTIITQNSKYTVQQNAGSVTPPNGFTNYMGITSSSAYSVLSSDYFIVMQKIEGFNVADLGWGTANAQAVTISFWARSSLTGTFGGCLSNSGWARNYGFTYTISSANTWEYKTVTIAGDTTGTWNTTNGQGLILNFSLGAGSSFTSAAGSWTSSYAFQSSGCVNLVGTNGATLYITGVQLEKGSTATSFDYRPYGTELQLCQRYYYRTTPGASGNPFNGTGVAQGTTIFYGVLTFPVTMRVAPSALEQDGVAADYHIYNGTGNINCSAVPAFGVATPWATMVQFTVASGISTSQSGLARANNSTAYLGWSAEL